MENRLIMLLALSATMSLCACSSNSGNNSSTVDLGINPVVDSAKNIVTYGLYPQSYISDSSLISELDSSAESLPNGWYKYKGEYYVKQWGKPYCGGRMIWNMTYEMTWMTFSNGVYVRRDKEYWFKCSPIQWQIIQKTNNEYYLLSSLIVDCKTYGTTTKYDTSYIREWLNGDFYNLAFGLGKSNILRTTVDNSVETLEDNSKYSLACENTQDYVFLPSYQEYKSILSSNFAFAKFTDYAIANGLRNINKYNAYYWTRSPSINETVSSIFSSMEECDFVSIEPNVEDSVSGTHLIGVRPAIKIRL